MATEPYSHNVMESLEVNISRKIELSQVILATGKCGKLGFELQQV